jgi:hypothetical protein
MHTKGDYLERLPMGDVEDSQRLIVGQAGLPEFQGTLLFANTSSLIAWNRFRQTSSILLKGPSPAARQACSICAQLLCYDGHAPRRLPTD